MSNDGKKTVGTEAPENRSRRKAVKTIVGGVTALAAYNVLPVKWEKPIIEQVFLPAHAQTSGTLYDPCVVNYLEGDSIGPAFLVEGYVAPPVGQLPVTIVVTPSQGGVAMTSITVTTATLGDGTFSARVNTFDGVDRVDVTTTVEGAEGSATCFEVKEAPKTQQQSNSSQENPPAEDPPTEPPPEEPPTEGGTLTIVRVSITHGSAGEDFTAGVYHSRVGLTSDFRIQIYNLSRNISLYVNPNWTPGDSTTFVRDDFGPFPDADDSVREGDDVEFRIFSALLDTVDFTGPNFATAAIS